MTGFYLALELNIWNFYCMVMLWVVFFFLASQRIMLIVAISIFLLCFISFSILYEFLPSSSSKQLNQLKQPSN